MTAPGSIVLVTVDCLRADHTGFMGYDRPTTPFLDSLAAESFVFPAAIVAGAPTYYSFPAILGGRAPLALGRDVLGVAPSEPTLASVVKKAGYATAAFSAANPYISARFGYDQGFDTFRDHLDALTPPACAASAAASNRWFTRLNRALFKASRRSEPAARWYDDLYFEYCQRWAAPPATSLDSLRCYPAADTMVDEARSWLSSLGSTPFFLWLHLMDPHAPYYPPEKALHLMGQRNVSASHARYVNAYYLRNDARLPGLARHRDAAVALYDAGIRWVDEQVARLVDALRRFHLWDCCVLCLTADHGEEFLEHGGRHHPPSRLFEELIRVPMLLRVPDSAKKELSPSPFSLVDLSPTLMDAAQVPESANCSGRSRWQQILHGESWNEPAVVECVAECTNPFHRENRFGPRLLAVRERRYKLILASEPPGDQLFDLEADPAERSPLPPHAAKPVRRRLLEFARTHVSNSVQCRDSALLLKARLRDLRLEWAQPMQPSQTAGF